MLILIKYPSYSEKSPVILNAALINDGSKKQEFHFLEYFIILGLRAALIFLLQLGHCIFTKGHLIYLTGLKRIVQPHSQKNLYF